MLGQITRRRQGRRQRCSQLVTQQRQKIVLGFARHFRRRLGRLQFFLEPFPLRYIPERPNSPHRPVVDLLQLRVSLEHPPVGELHDIERLRNTRIVNLFDLGKKFLRIPELFAEYFPATPGHWPIESSRRETPIISTYFSLKPVTLWAPSVITMASVVDSSVARIMTSELARASAFCSSSFFSRASRCSAPVWWIRHRNRS